MTANNCGCRESCTLTKQSADLLSSLTHTLGNLINKNKANNISLITSIYKAD